MQAFKDYSMFLFFAWDPKPAVSVHVLEFCTHLYGIFLFYTAPTATHTHRRIQVSRNEQTCEHLWTAMLSVNAHAQRPTNVCSPAVFAASRSVNLLRQILLYAAVSIKIFQPHSDATVLVCEHNATSRYGQTARQLSLSVEWLHLASIDVHHARWPSAFFSRAEAVAHNTVPHLSEHGNLCSARWVHQPVILSTPEGLRPRL